MPIVFKKFEAVVVPDGRIGMARPMPDGRVEVQFGAAGPFEMHGPGSLRCATEREVKDAGMHGIGGLICRDRELGFAQNGRRP